MQNFGKTLMLQTFFLTLGVTLPSWSMDLFQQQKTNCFQTLEKISTQTPILLKRFEKINSFTDVHEKGLPDAIYEMLKSYRQTHEVEFYSHPMDIEFFKIESESRVLGYRVVLQHDDLHSMTFTYSSSKPGAGFLYHVETKTPGPIFSNEFPCEDSREQVLQPRM